MKTRNLIAIASILCLSISALAAEKIDPLGNLPKGVYTQLKTHGFFDVYSVCANLNPYYQRADFNGDGRVDIALVIESKITQKRGIVFIHEQEGYYHVIGAGKDTGPWGDDFKWMTKWQVVPKDWNRPSVEALVLDHPEADKALVYLQNGQYKIRPLDIYSNFSDDPALTHLQMLPDLAVSEY